MGNGKEEESEDPGGKGAEEGYCTTKRQGKHRRGNEAFIRRDFEADPLSTGSPSQNKFLHLQSRKKKNKKTKKNI